MNLGLQSQTRMQALRSLEQGKMMLLLLLMNQDSLIRMNLTNKNNEIGSQDGLGNTKNMDDMNMDKEEAFADPLGLKLDETNPIEED